MTRELRKRVRFAIRPDYRVEWGRAAPRAPSIELDLTALVLFSGRCRVIVGEESALLEAPAVVLVNPATALGFEPARGAEWVVVSLATAAVERAAGAVGLDTAGEIVFASPFGRPSEETILAARYLVSELVEHRGRCEAALDHAVALVALNLLRSHARVDRSARLERSRAGLVDRRLRRAVEFMHDNFDRDLAIGEIAAAAYSSEFHFARLFKRITGQTPHGYLASLRLTESKRLLAATDLGVAEVGAKVGYHSPSHFAKVFRASTGLTPTAFREALDR